MLPIRSIVFLLTFWLLAAGAAAFAAPNPLQRSGRYAVELRVPAEGAYAGEETDLAFRVTDAARGEPVAIMPGALRAKIEGGASGPLVRPTGVPGEYGLITRFPRGGAYRIELTIHPPGEESPFAVTFPVEVREADAARKPAPAPFTLEASTDPARPAAGKPVTITLVIRVRETDRPVTDFDTVHDKPIHLLLVREDLGALFHEFPEPGPDGRFTLRFTFPAGGNWRLFAEVAPRGAGPQTALAALAVDGPRGMRTILVPALRPTVRQSGMTLTMNPINLAARETLPLLFTLTDTSGRPLTDLQPWLGAVAHLFLIERDGRTLVHALPDETDPRHGRNGNLAFLVRFPKPGIYRGWTQFRRGVTAYALPFVLRVAGD